MESPDYEHDNEFSCPICKSFDLQRIGGHVYRCRDCGAMWCESCTD